ncbi:MAG TPA: hypothetical protein VK900_16450 [Anaerolineales bacterium]|nr:hypothetical protein [Anaerolineales bacterium]
MATSRKNQDRNTKSRSSGRKAPGSGGRGNYYHIELRDGDDFETFRTQDVGDEGHLQRVAGKRPSGAWATVKWLVSKEDAHVEDGKLFGDSGDAKDLIRRLRSRPVHIQGDRFKAKPRRNIAENAKPTKAQSRARNQNIKKAQGSRRRG